VRFAYASCVPCAVQTALIADVSVRLFVPGLLFCINVVGVAM
jgi:hypothetical protein